MISKQDLIKKVSEKTNIAQTQVRNVVDMLLETIKDSLVDGEKVSLLGFCSFEVVNTKEKTGVNPSTQEKIIIPAGKKVKVSVSKTVKDAVKGSN